MRNNKPVNLTDKEIKEILNKIFWFIKYREYEPLSHPVDKETMSLWARKGYLIKTLQGLVEGRHAFLDNSITSQDFHDLCHPKLEEHFRKLKHQYNILIW